MSDIKRRVERLEEILMTQDCGCPKANDPCAIVIVEPGWTAADIARVEDEKAPRCLIHGLRAPILNLSGSDAYG